MGKSLSYVFGGRNGDEHGQAVVEFVLVAPILLLLFFGIVDVGRMVSFDLTCDQAASDVAARVQAGSTASASDMQSFVDASYAQLDGKAIVSMTSPASGDKVTGYVHHLPTGDGSFVDRDSNTTVLPTTVTVTYDGSFITPLAPMLSYFTNGGTSDGTFKVSKSYSATSDKTVVSGNW